MSEKIINKNAFSLRALMVLVFLILLLPTPSFANEISVNTTSGHVGDSILVTYNITSNPDIVTEYTKNDGTPDGYVSITDTYVRAISYNVSFDNEDLETVCFYGRYTVSNGGYPIVAFYSGENQLCAGVNIKSASNTWYCVNLTNRFTIDAECLVGIRCLNCYDGPGTSNDVKMNLMADNGGNDSYLWDGNSWTFQPSVIYYIEYNTTKFGYETYLKVKDPNGKVTILDTIGKNSNKTNANTTITLNNTGYYDIYIESENKETVHEFVNSKYATLRLQTDYTQGSVDNSSVIFFYIYGFDEKGNAYLPPGYSFDCELFKSDWSDNPDGYNQSYISKTLSSNIAYFEYFDYSENSNHLNPGDYIMSCSLSTSSSSYEFTSNFRVEPNNQEVLNNINNGNNTTIGLLNQIIDLLDANLNNIMDYLQYLEQSEHCGYSDEFGDGSTSKTGDYIDTYVVVDKDATINNAILNVTNTNTVSINKEWAFNYDHNDWTSAVVTDSNGYLWISGDYLRKIDATNGSTVCSQLFDGNINNYINPTINNSDGLIYVMKSHYNNDREIMSFNLSDCSQVNTSGKINMTVWSNALKEYKGKLFFGAYDLNGGKNDDTSYLCMIDKSLDNSTLTCWDNLGTGNTIPVFYGDYIYTGRGNYLYKINGTKLINNITNPIIYNVSTGLQSKTGIYLSLSPNGEHLYFDKSEYTNWYTKSFYTSNMTLRWQANYSTTTATWSTSPPTWSPYGVITIGSYDNGNGNVVGINDTTGSIIWRNVYTDVQDENYFVSMNNLPLVITQGRDGGPVHILNVNDGSHFYNITPTTNCNSQDPVLYNGDIYVCGLEKYTFGKGNNEITNQKYDLQMSGYAVNGLTSADVLTYTIGNTNYTTMNQENNITTALQNEIKNCNSTVCKIPIKVYGNNTTVTILVNSTIPNSKCVYMQEQHNSIKDLINNVNSSLYGSISNVESTINSNQQELHDDTIQVYRAFPTTLPQDRVYTLYVVKNMFGEDYSSSDITVNYAELWDTLGNNLYYDAVANGGIYAFNGYFYIYWDFHSIDKGNYAIYVDFDVDGKKYQDWFNVLISNDTAGGSSGHLGNGTDIYLTPLTDGYFDIGDNLPFAVGLQNKTSSSLISSANCYFNVYYPNNSLWLNNIPTSLISGSGIYINKTFNATSVYGEYNYLVRCNLNGQDFYNFGNFKVVNSYLYELAFLVLVIVSSFIFAYLSVKSNDWIFQYFFILLSVGFIVVSFGSSVSILEHYNTVGQYDNLLKITNTVYAVGIWILVGLSMFLFVKLLIWFGRLVKNEKSDYEAY